MKTTLAMAMCAVLLAGCDPFAKNPAADAFGPQWETYSNRGTVSNARSVWRMRVDGGWLYTTSRGGDGHPIFVPDVQP